MSRLKTHYARIVPGEPVEPLCGRVPRAVANMSTGLRSVSCRWCIERLILIHGSYTKLFEAVAKETPSDG